MARFGFTNTLVVAVAVFLALGITPPAHAEEGDISWAVQPSSADGPDGRDTLTYTLAPGESVTDYVGVSNLGAEPLEMRVYAMDAAMTADGAFTLPPADTESKDVGSWVGITGGGTYTIEPGTRQDIPFRLAVPPTASPGDHAGGIVASLSTLGSSGAGSQQVSVDRRVGVRIYVNVPGDRKPELSVSDVSVKYVGLLNPVEGSTTVTYSVKNTGNVRLGGNSAVSLSGIVGGAVGSATPRTLPEILPGSTVQFEETIDGVFPTVLLDATVTVDPVSVGDAGDDAGSQVVGHGRTWAIPYIIAGVVLLLAGLIFGLWARGRRWRRRAQASSAMGPLRTRDRRGPPTESAPPAVSAQVSASGSDRDSRHLIGANAPTDAPADSAQGSH
jgi:hypothetical protein